MSQLTAVAQAVQALAPWQQYICHACGHIYNEADGDPDSGLAAGTRFADIPEDWACPLCGVTKSDFEIYQPSNLDAQRAKAQNCGPVPSAGQRIRVTTECGQHFDADQVIAATGLQTPSRLAQSASLAWQNGIAVDSQTLRTSNPAIHAMGDCITIDGQASRFIEPISRQAKTIAATITGCEPAPYEQRPMVVRVKTTSMPLTLH